MGIRLEPLVPSSRLSVDYEEEMAFAAVVGPQAQERIAAASSYYLSPATHLAEVAYMVDPDWQGAGLGGILHAALVEYAREHGARGLTADMLLRNSRMMRVGRPRADHALLTARIVWVRVRAGDDMLRSRPCLPGR